MRAPAPGRGLHNVPADLTSFVGRRRELAEIKQRMAASRLVTLTGPGGVGKTRLALRAAASMVRAFPDGVWLIELAAIQDPPLLTQAVFNGLGLQDTSAGWSVSRLTEYLSEKHLLLILDNCEHLLDSCAVLTRSLLRSCPRLRVLATSRQALATEGEVRMRVPSLSLPDDDAPAGADLLNFDAVALLADRAAAVDSAFRLDAHNARRVLRLCRRLDGIPLALELVAARLDALGLEQLTDLVDRDLLFPAGKRGGEARQQTLEAAIEWSYRLLTEQERRLWIRLSVFAGSFDQEAAIQVCSGPELPDTQIATLLATLVEKSMVNREPETQPTRYALLETLREFGGQRLLELGGEADQLQRRHRDWVLKLAREAGNWDHRQAEAFNRVYLERNNVWAALDFCVRKPGEAELGIEIARNIYTCWTARGPLTDARRVIGSLLQLVPDDSVGRARGLFVAATLAWSQGDHEEARHSAEESVRIGRALGDDEVVSRSLVTLGVVAWVNHRTTDAYDLLTGAIALAKESNNWKNVLAGQCALSGVLLAERDFGPAAEVAEEGLSLSLKSGELWVRGLVLGFLADARWQLGDWDGAVAALREAIRSKSALDDRIGLASLLEATAWILAERGLAEPAAAVLGRASSMRESLGAPIFGPLLGRHENASRFARDRLGEAAYSSAFGYGKAITIEELVAFALDDKKPTRAAQPSKREASAGSGSRIALTRREQQIASLVADGLSNKQIATKLVVSERTAETHVLNILNKLGFNSRTQIASWTAAQQPLTGAPKT